MVATDKAAMRSVRRDFWDLAVIFFLLQLLNRTVHRGAGDRQAARIAAALSKTGSSVAIPFANYKCTWSAKLIYLILNTDSVRRG